MVTGGYVRDTVLGLESKDIDVEVFGLSPKALANVLAGFGKVTEAGRSFGVLKVNMDGQDVDFSMPRSERKAGTGHKGFDVTVDSELPMEKAVLRRDLTINALMFDPLEDRVIDFVGGMEDMKSRVLRHVSEAFGEDPLRVLRVAQFSARFDFDIAAETVELCRSLVGELSTLPKERIYAELEKAMMKGTKPSRAFRFLAEIDALRVVLPELDTLRAVEQKGEHHTEGSAFEHTMLALDTITMADRTVDVMFGILFHDLGKAVVDSDGQHFYGHAEAGVPIAKSAMERITDEIKLTDSVLALVANHMRPFDLIKSGIKKSAVRRLALKVDMEKLMKLHKADKLGRGEPGSIVHISAISDVFEAIRGEIRPIVLGRHLIEMGLTPGVEFGRLLRELFELQLSGEFSDLDGGLREARKLLK